MDVYRTEIEQRKQALLASRLELQPESQHVSSHSSHRRRVAGPFATTFYKVNGEAETIGADPISHTSQPTASAPAVTTSTTTSTRRAVYTVLNDSQLVPWQAQDSPFKIVGVDDRRTPLGQAAITDSVNTRRSSGAGVANKQRCQEQRDGDDSTGDRESVFDRLYSRSRGRKDDKENNNHNQVRRRRRPRSREARARVAAASERLYADAARRSEELERKRQAAQAAREVDPELTLRPVITEKARSLRRQDNVYERLYGCAASHTGDADSSWEQSNNYYYADEARVRQQNRERLQLAAEQREMAECTFAPETSLTASYRSNCRASDTASASRFDQLYRDSFKRQQKLAELAAQYQPTYTFEPHTNVGMRHR